MITWSDIEKLSNARTLNLPDNIQITGVTLDSRTIEHGMLFIARQGEETDGHRFVGSAIQNGAAAVIVEQRWYLSAAPASDWPLVIVPDSDQALREMARIVRKKMKGPVIGITGTNGKTTTRSMINHVLSAGFSPLSTAGNYNNLWGLPLTILREKPENDIWILEHGMNQPGEMQKLCDISQPTVGLVTTIGEAHSHFFDSIDQIADNKFDLYRSLPSDGITFLNMNDERIRDFTPETNQVVTYGIDRPADFSATVESVDKYNRVRLSIKDIGSAQLQVFGTFQGINALAAAAVGATFGISPADICERLESFKAVAGRGRVITTDNKTIIDDSYNANPDSMKAALDILASFPAQGRRVAILGDMLELNSTREEKHRMIGQYAAKLGIDLIIGVGPLANLIVENAKADGVAKTRHFNNISECLDAIEPLLELGDTVLLKGSHGIHIEKLLEVV